MDHIQAELNASAARIEELRDENEALHARIEDGEGNFELYRQILGLTPPWTVVSVTLDVPAEEVVVQVDAGPGPFACPECGAVAPRYDRKPRRWRHLDTMQFTTWIAADVPCVDCPSHGVKQLRVPWAEPGSQFTALFERLAIDLLRECSITGAVKLLRISWDEGWGIKARAVKRGVARRAPAVVSRIGVDEKAIAKRHRYLTIVADLEQSRVRRPSAPPSAPFASAMTFSE